MRAIDLHVHSNYSDGTMTPAELVDLAIEKKLKAIALTDHDCITGIEDLNKALEARSDGGDLELIPGVELSTDWSNRDIHIVGLYVDTKNEEFLKYLQEFLDSRDVRNKKMCDALREGEGFDITYEKLTKEFEGSIITRAHYARYLMDRGYVKSRDEAFIRYIGDGKKYYIPRAKQTPMEGVELIHRAGGIAVLAHPVLYGFGKEKLDKLVSMLKECGLDGIEATYSTYTPSDERDIKALAKKYDLLLSGGSDFHGSNKPLIDLGTGMGHLFVPEEYLEKIKLLYKERCK